MPAVSKKQQIAMAIAEHNPSKLHAGNKALLALSHKQLHDFASTPRKNLPNSAPKMHDGGIVPADGTYTLQKGENVIPKDTNMAKKHDYTHSTTEHHDDGSHTTTHHHKDGKTHKKYASANHDQMMKGMADNIGPAAEPPMAEAAPPAAPMGGAAMPPPAAPGV